MAVDGLVGSGTGREMEFALSPVPISASQQLDSV